MADLQTPTEASLFSTTNPSSQFAIPVPNEKEANMQVSLSEVKTEPSASPTSTSTSTSTPTPTTVNGMAPAVTNGVGLAPKAAPTPTPTFTSTSTPAAAVVTHRTGAAAAAGAGAETKTGEYNHDDDPPLFSPSLIGDHISACLPEGYSIRPLRRSDYYGGFLPTLRVLTTVGEPTLAEFNARYDFMASRNDTYYILVICDTSGTVVGTGAVIVERKFIHHMGLVGHIEDIAVAKNQQGKKLGLRIIHALDSVAERVGCYKSILDCSEANEGFYVKCGFKRAGLEMAHYYEKTPRTSL